MDIEFTEEENEILRDLIHYVGDGFVSISRDECLLWMTSSHRRNQTLVQKIGSLTDSQIQAVLKNISKDKVTT